MGKDVLALVVSTFVFRPLGRSRSPRLQLVFTICAAWIVSDRLPIVLKGGVAAKSASIYKLLQIELSVCLAPNSYLIHKK